MDLKSSLPHPIERESCRRELRRDTRRVLFWPRNDRNGSKSLISGIIARPGVAGPVFDGAGEPFKSKPRPPADDYG